jgi:hypothetical protein
MDEEADLTANFKREFCYTPGQFRGDDLGSKVFSPIKLRKPPNLVRFEPGGVTD